MKKLRRIARRWGNFMRTGMTDKKNLIRDIVITSISIILLGGIVLGSRISHKNHILQDEKNAFVPNEEVQGDVPENPMIEEIRRVRENIDVSEWKTQKNSWFGYEIRYPEDWKNPVSLGAFGVSKWEGRIQFRRNKLAEDNSYAGFDLVIYSTNKISDLKEMDEFPKLIEGITAENGGCESIKDDEIIDMGDDYPAEEIYITAGDDCYEPTLFFTFTKDAYIYNMVPVKKSGLENIEDQKQELMNEMPEFFSAVATLKNIDVVQTVQNKNIAKRPITRRISAPFPLVYTRDSLGRMVCDKKNDHPMKSIKHKGKHMDMECCLDPDEIPNPHCYYSPSKYGKYL